MTAIFPTPLPRSDIQFCAKRKRSESGSAVPGLTVGDFLRFAETLNYEIRVKGGAGGGNFIVISGNGLTAPITVVNDLNTNLPRDTLSAAAKASGFSAARIEAGIRKSKGKR
ncbi:MAG: hypothetical protein AB7P76_12350 [Candidatus Melainabacteria bacterium]